MVSGYCPVLLFHHTCAGRVETLRLDQARLRKVTSLHLLQAADFWPALLLKRFGLVSYQRLRARRVRERATEVARI
jgi:hypothetical protein